MKSNWKELEIESEINKIIEHIEQWKEHFPRMEVIRFSNIGEEENGTNL